MSEYLVCDTEMDDLDVILETLEELGFPSSKVVVHATPVNLEGYRGDQRQQQANIVIKRQQVGAASNDIGFEKQNDGSYKAWVSSYDKSKGLGREITGGRMKRLYNKNKTLREAKRHGMRVQSCEEEDGKIRMKIFPR
jgi:hypothetical protein